MLRGDRAAIRCTIFCVGLLVDAKAFLAEQVLVAILIVFPILHLHLAVDVSSDSCSAVPRLYLNDEQFIFLRPIEQLSIVVRLREVLIVLP